MSGQWKSTGKIGMSYEAGTVFTAGPVFNQQYYYYEKGEGPQKAYGVSTCVGNGPGGFYPPRTKEFAPDARECGEWGSPFLICPANWGRKRPISRCRFMGSTCRSDLKTVKNASLPYRHNGICASEARNDMARAGASRFQSRRLPLCKRYCRKTISRPIPG